MSEVTKKAWIICLIGFIVGASIGYFYRPPALFIGQLPFDIVITRGGTLKGLDQIYLDVAKKSFNYLLFGGIAGAVLGAVVGARMSRSPSSKQD